jgi:hypothetical protein
MDSQMMNAWLSWKAFLLYGVGLFGAGDIVPTDTSPYIQFGALGILAVAVFKLFSALKDQQEINDKLAGRQDKWEQMRHDDHESLSETLRAMTANCASVQAKRDANKD